MIQRWGWICGCFGLPCMRHGEKLEKTKRSIRQHHVNREPLPSFAERGRYRTQGVKHEFSTLIFSQRFRRLSFVSFTSPRSYRHSAVNREQRRVEKDEEEVRLKGISRKRTIYERMRKVARERRNTVPRNDTTEEEKKKKKRRSEMP